MGWNSFDCFGASVTEAEVLANAEFLAKHLKPYGWDHVVVDYCWSHPNPPACTNPNQFAEYQPYLWMDGDFRLLPAPERFPSSKNGAGFAPLAEKVHRLGLKFGVHIMRGLPRQAMYPGYPAVNLKHRPTEMADPDDTCTWLNHMYGVRADLPEGQEYYNSLFRLYASWGVDFVKADDLTYPYRAAEIEAIDRARKQAGRSITLSLSPGPCPLDQASHVAAHADLWRISADFWDDWKKLKEMFAYCASWAPYRKLGAWPDADMLPIGRLSKRGPVGPEHDSFFTREEQRTMVGLWALFRSPLFIGGNLPEMNGETLALLTNTEVLEVHRNGTGAFPLGEESHPAVWVSNGLSPDTLHVGIFNLEDSVQKAGFAWREMGWNHPPKAVRDLWLQKDVVPDLDGLEVSLPPHGSALFTIQLQENYSFVQTKASRMPQHISHSRNPKTAVVAT
jgi:alpha-galactosidase